MTSTRPAPAAERPGRRRAVQALWGAVAIGVVPAASATPESMRVAIETFTGGAVPADGGMRLEVPEIVENGNSVPVAVTVDGPMTESRHVRRIAVFSEKNPYPLVVTFVLGPHNGAARVGTRMRLADSQRLVAVAQFSDGTWRRHSVDVIVTLAACIEEN
jgi:sulfur-oxidizing protein SoxY